MDRWMAIGTIEENRGGKEKLIEVRMRFFYQIGALDFGEKKEEMVR